MAETLNEFLDGRDFYEAMQTYRWASAIDQDDPVRAFEQVKTLIRQAALQEFADAQHYRSLQGKIDEQA